MLYTASRHISVEGYFSGSQIVPHFQRSFDTTQYLIVSACTVFRTGCFFILVTYPYIYKSMLSMARDDLMPDMLQ